MKYEIITKTTLVDVLNCLTDNEVGLVTEEDIKVANEYIDQGKSYLFAFSDVFNVFVDIKKNPMVKDVIEKVVYEYTLSEEGNLKKLALLFKNELNEIYEQMIILSDVGINNFINNPNNPNHHIIQEVIFNLINPYKILVVNP